MDRKLYVVFINFTQMPQYIKINEYLEHTILKPDTSIQEVEKICNEALIDRYAAICVPPLFVKAAKNILGESEVKLATVAGFPFGYSAIEAKLSEIVLALVDGADELEMVVNTSAIKNKDWQYIAKEINSVMPLIRSKERQLTVIWETDLLSNEEITACCDIYGAAGVDFVKLGTGYPENTITPQLVQSVRTRLADAVQIKANVGFKNYNFAKQLINAGAVRLGVYNSRQLIQEALELAG